MPAAVWPVLALVVAVVVGICVGGGAYYLGSAGSDGGWDELGAFLLGVALGIVALVAAYLAGMAVSARRAFLPGQRILPFALSLAIPALLVATAVALTAVAESTGTNFPQAMGVVAFVGAVVAAPAAFAWAGTGKGRRRLALGTAGLVALMVVATGAQIAVARQQLEAVADRMPFVLFARDSVNAPFDGWHRDTFRTITITADRTPIGQGQQAVLKYFAQADVVFITMHTKIDRCQDTALYTCRTSGTLQGNETRRYERIAKYGAYPRSDALDVLVYPDGTAVSVNDDESRNWPRTTRDFTAAQVLKSLVRVDREQFERATGSKLRLG